ncbi:MAG: FkbM family methyltransferase [Solirubrobacteraceae bacterium]
MIEIFYKIKKKGIFFYLNNYFTLYFFRVKKKFIKTINYQSIKIKIVLNSSNGTVDNSIMRRGYFGENIIPEIQKELNRNKNFIDVGANIGLFSLILSNYCNKVYSFEPIQRLHNQFKESIELNNFNNIELFNYGCGNEEITSEITINPMNAGGSTVLSHNNDITGVKKELIKLNTLDNLITDINVDVIKINVEGFEYFVLLGAKKIISKFKPIIFMEYSPNLYEKINQGMSRELYDFIKSYNYSIYNLTSNKLFNSFEELPTHQCDLKLIYK